MVPSERLSGDPGEFLLPCSHSGNFLFRCHFRIGPVLCCTDGFQAVTLCRSLPPEVASCTESSKHLCHCVSWRPSSFARFEEDDAGLLPLGKGMYWTCCQGLLGSPRRNGGGISALPSKVLDAGDIGDLVQRNLLLSSCAKEPVAQMRALVLLRARIGNWTSVMCLLPACLQERNHLLLFL